MSIKKSDMAARIVRAASATPDLEARFRHAQEHAYAHPAGGPFFPSSSYSAPEQETTIGHTSKFVSVSIDLIDSNPYNARKIYRQERVTELASSIGTHGQNVPGISTMRDGRYVLVAGHYRFRAIKALGRKHMDLMVHDNLTDKELFGYSYRENVEREGQSALDNALCWRDLLDHQVFASETELSEATGISLPNINKTLRILSLSDAVLDVVKEEPTLFALTALYELALFEEAADQASTLALAIRIKQGDAGRKEVQEARANLSNQKERKRKETSRPYKLLRDGAAIGSLKTWDSGRVLLDVVLTETAEHEQLLAELKQRFGVSG